MADVLSRLTGGSARMVISGDTSIAVEVLGDGDRTVLLVHGFPHTRVIWRDVADALLADGVRVIAMDMRGLGDSGRPASGFDLDSISGDLAAVLDALGSDGVHAVGIDLGVPAVFALAATRPGRVTSLTLIEGTLGTLPGAEEFLRNGPPWWFGFHQAPNGLAERTVEGSEDVYVRHFLGTGSARGLPEGTIETIVDAYRGRDSLRCAFDYYREMPAAAQWISNWARDHRLAMPVLTIGGSVVGDATARQVGPLADIVHSHVLPDAGHIVCVDQPARTAALLIDFIRGIS